MASLIKKADIVANVPKRWAEQYKDWKDRGDKWDKGEITRSLLALPAGFSAQEVNDIIGNTSWTEVHCDECGNESEILVRLGQGQDYEARWVDLCERCLREGLYELEQENG